MAICLLTVAVAVAGCAALSAALRTDAALHAAGYTNAGVTISEPNADSSGGLISVSYSRGPAGNDERDAQHAEKIVWDTFAARFGAVAIIKTSGGCVGPVCGTHSTEVASATYAQLADQFGPRPKGLDTASPAGPFTVPRWAIFLGAGLALLVVAGGIIVLTLVVRTGRNPSRRQSAWQPGPGQPPWPSGQPPWQQGPPGQPPWHQGPPGHPSAPPVPPGSPGGGPA